VVVYDASEVPLVRAFFEQMGLGGNSLPHRSPGVAWRATFAAPRRGRCRLPARVRAIRTGRLRRWSLTPKSWVRGPRTSGPTGVQGRHISGLPVHASLPLMTNRLVIELHPSP